MPARIMEFCGVIKGVQQVADAGCRHHREFIRHFLLNTDFQNISRLYIDNTANCVIQLRENPLEQINKLQEGMKDINERGCAISEGLFYALYVHIFKNTKLNQQIQGKVVLNSSNEIDLKHSNDKFYDTKHLDISSITLNELEEILSKGYNLNDHKLIKNEEMFKNINFNKPIVQQKQIEENDKSPIFDAEIDSKKFTSSWNAKITLPVLSEVSKQRAVPSSRLGRMASFGGLFAGLGFGTIQELTKGALGLGGSKNVKEALLSPSNAERIVDTLCKVRGAALKIGQILSIQDSTIVSPQLARAFERVRQAADYMPDWQVERVMSREFGVDWRKVLSSFDEKPFAAASIGQVHRASLKNGTEVAIKIQYPGVAQSIESDIDNLVNVLKVWDIFPQGFFIDNVVKVAKRELKWEVDYNREAEYTEKFKEIISNYSEYYVPAVTRELTSSNVLTTELVPGVPLDKCFDISYDDRKHIAESVLKLCLRELFEFHCMQTDPNWSNFLYDAKSKRLMLIDFGSTRFYKKTFINNYRKVIMCAANNDRGGVLKMSQNMGFLTGYESKQMEEAHVDAVMILGEIFRYDGNFDFGKQNTTERIARLVPTMVEHRLCPPPEEIYSIHRKLSGIFLLCSRLNIKMNCRILYNEIVLKDD